MTEREAADSGIAQPIAFCDTCDAFLYMPRTVQTHRARMHKVHDERTR